MIDEAIHKVLESKNKPYPSHVNRISSLDDECSRRLYYHRVEWDKKLPRDDNF